MSQNFVFPSPCTKRFHPQEINISDIPLVHCNERRCRPGDSMFNWGVRKERFRRWFWCVWDSEKNILVCLARASPLVSPFLWRTGLPVKSETGKTGETTFLKFRENICEKLKFENCRCETWARHTPIPFSPTQKTSYARLWRARFSKRGQKTSRMHKNLSDGGVALSFEHHQEG